MNWGSTKSANLVQQYLNWEDCQLYFHVKHNICNQIISRRDLETSPGDFWSSLGIKPGWKRLFNHNLECRTSKLYIIRDAVYIETSFFCWGPRGGGGYNKSYLTQVISINQNNMKYKIIHTKYKPNYSSHKTYDFKKIVFTKYVIIF